MTNHKDLDDNKPPPMSSHSLSEVETLDDFLDVLLGVAESIREWHMENRLHGVIDPTEVVFLDSTGKWSLLPPSNGNEQAREIFPFPDDAPWFDVSEKLETLPRNIDKAQDEVNKNGLKINVAIVDCFAIGQLACRLFADCSVIDYLQSPKVLSQIPEEFRPFIDGSLGFDSNNRFENIDELITNLKNIQKAQTASSAEDQHSNPDTPDPFQATKIASVPPLETSTTLPFKKIGHFDLRRLIGSGGMGDVYEGYDESLKRKVAVKVLPPELGRHESFVQRFYSEAASVAKIVHPNIVQIFFIGEDHGHHFFAMEYIEGQSLADQLAQSPLSVSESLSVAEQILKGLSSAHKVGLVHRDVKPGNILVERETNRCLLADFGLVKSLQDENGPTHSGMVLGTMDYISPEQGSGRAVDARSDLYSLGVVLYEIMSGKLPFYADSPTGMIFQHVYERPLPLAEVVYQVPTEVSAIVSKLMAKDPSHRYDSAVAVLTDLTALQNGESLPSRAGQLLLEDPLCFSRPAQVSVSSSSGTSSKTAIISAPVFEDLEDEYEVLNRGPSNLFERIVERCHDWLEKKSPILAERLQNTQLQIDRAILHRERHRDQLASLDHDAKIILKQLKQEILAKQQIQDDDDNNPDNDLLLKELKLAFHEQEEQADAIRLQLNRINAQLVQMRTERDVLFARLTAAQARQNIDGNRRQFPVYGATVIAGICLVFALFVFGILPGIPLLSYINSSSTPTASPVTIKPSVASVPSRKWPVKARGDITIPLPANVLAMDIAVTQYSGKPAYTLLAMLDDNTVVEYYFRIGLDYIKQRGFPGIPFKVKSLAISPNATYMALSADDNSIQIIDLKRAWKDEYRKLDGHVQPVNNLGFSIDESTLVSMSEDRTIRFWDIRSGAEIRRFEVGRNRSAMMAFNRGLSRVLIGKQPPYANMFSLWNSVGANEQQVFQAEGKTTTVALSANAKTALSLSGGQVHVWDTATGKSIRKFAPGSSDASFATRVGRALTLGNGQLKLWKTDTGKLIETKQVKMSPSSSAKVLLPENGEVGIVATTDKQLHIYHLSEISPPNELAHRFNAETAIHSIDISSDGKWIAGGGEGKIYLWNMDHPAASFTFDSPNVISTVSISPKGNLLAYGTGQEESKTNYVGIRKLDHNSQIEHFMKRTNDWRKLSGFEDRISSVAWNSAGKLVLISSQDGQIKSWEPQKDEIKSSIHLKQPVLRFANFNDPQALFVTGTTSIGIWNQQVSSSINEFMQTPFPIVDMTISPDKRLIGVAARDGQISIYASNDKSQFSLLKSDNDFVTDLCFIPTTDMLVASYMSGIVRIWDTVQSKEIKKYIGTPSPVLALDVTPDARYVVSASQNGNVNVWKLP